MADWAHQQIVPGFRVELPAEAITTQRLPSRFGWDQAERHGVELGKSLAMRTRGVAKAAFHLLSIEHVFCLTRSGQYQGPATNTCSASQGPGSIKVPRLAPLAWRSLVALNGGPQHAAVFNFSACRGVQPKNTPLRS